jgi:hypothetical protein
MSWGAIDDHLDDDPRWMGLPLAAAGLYLCVMPYCLRARRNFIPSQLIGRVGSIAGERPESDALIEAGLWLRVDGGCAYIETDWDRITMYEQRQQASEAGKRSAESRLSKYGTAQPSRTATEPTPSGPSNDSRTTPERPLNLSPTPSPTPKREVAKATKRENPFHDDVRLVFETWVEQVVEQYGARSRPKPTPERYKIIQARLEQGYGVDDWLLAVKGWRRSDHHVKGHYFQLDLLGRNGTFLESFRDKELAAVSSGPPPAPEVRPAPAGIPLDEEGWPIRAPGNGFQSISESLATITGVSDPAGDQGGRS